MCSIPAPRRPRTPPEAPADFPRQTPADDATAPPPWRKRSNDSPSRASTAATKARSGSPSQDSGPPPGLTSKASPRPAPKRMPSSGPPPKRKSSNGPPPRPAGSSQDGLPPPIAATARRPPLVGMGTPAPTTIVPGGRTASADAERDYQKSLHVSRAWGSAQRRGTTAMLSREEVQRREQRSRTDIEVPEAATAPAMRRPARIPPA